MIPDTLAGLNQAGYSRYRRSKCKLCGSRLEWYWTPTRGKIPFSLKKDVVVGETFIYYVTSETRYEPHITVCVSVEDESLAGAAE
jgi:hypothetical protein